MMTRRTADLRCRIRSGYDACTFSPSSSVAREGGHRSPRRPRRRASCRRRRSARQHALSPRPDSTILRGHAPSFSSVCARDFPRILPRHSTTGPMRCRAFSRFSAGAIPPQGRPRDVVSRARSHLARVFAPRGVPPARHPRRLRARPPPPIPRQISSNIFKYLSASPRPSPPLSVARRSPSSPENLPAPRPSPQASTRRSS